jgi:hypothetical protein
VSTDERAQHRAEDAGHREHDVDLQTRRQRAAEQGWAAGERPGRDGARDDHDQLAADGQQRVDRHEEEHTDDAVRDDAVGDGLRDGCEHQAGADSARTRSGGVWSRFVMLR